MSLRSLPSTPYEMEALRRALHELGDRITEEGAHEINGTGGFDIIVDLLNRRLRRRIFSTASDDFHLICDLCECHEGTHTVDCPVEVLTRWADGRVA